MWGAAILLLSTVLVHRNPTASVYSTLSTHAPTGATVRNVGHRALHVCTPTTVLTMNLDTIHSSFDLKIRSGMFRPVTSRLHADTLFHWLVLPGRARHFADGMPQEP